MVIVIGAIATAIIAAVVGFLGVGAVATVFPQFQMFLFMIGAGLLAFMTKDLVFYQGDRWKLSGGLFFGAMAMTLIIAMVFGVTLPQFGASFVSIAGSVSPASVEGDGVFAGFASGLQALGVESISIVSILSVMAAVATLTVFTDAYYFKGKLLRRK